MMQATFQRVIELAIAIQQIPAPTFQEQARVAFVRERFLAEGGMQVEEDGAGNVLACLVGMGRSGPLVVSAHLDTVFPLDANLRVQRDSDRVYGAGIGDNALGVAALFGLAWLLKERNLNLPGDLWLAATVGEEGLGNLKGMTSLVERFGNTPLAYLVLEGMSLGHVYHRGLGVRRERISIRTEGGHSWTDYGNPSAVHELARLATRLTGIPLPGKPRCTLNVGKITGGTSINTIAAEAWLELDLRSESAEALEHLSQTVEKICADFRSPGIQVDVELIGSRPAGELDGSHRLVKLAVSALQKQGLQPVLNIASTEANLPLSLGYPALALGLTQGANGHTLHEYILTDPLRQGMEQLVGLVEAVYC